LSRLDTSRWSFSEVSRSFLSVCFCCYDEGNSGCFTFTGLL